MSVGTSFDTWLKSEFTQEQYDAMNEQAQRRADWFEDAKAKLIWEYKYIVWFSYECDVRNFDTSTLDHKEVWDWLGCDSVQDVRTATKELEAFDMVVYTRPAALPVPELKEQVNV